MKTRKTIFLSIIMTLITFVFVYVLATTDETEPTISVSSANPKTVTNGGTVQYTLVFSDDTKIGSINITSSYVKPKGFTGNISITGSGSTRYITISNIQSDPDSDNYVTIRAGAATDTSGNNTSTINSPKFTVIEEQKDTTKPTVSVSSANPKSVTCGEKVTYTVYFEDDTGIGSINMDSSYVELNGFSGSVSVTGSGNTRYVTISNVQSDADSDNYITIKAGAVKDKAGNTSSQISSSKFSVTKAVVLDETEPTISISSASSSSIYEGESIKYTVMFSDETGLGNINLDSSYISLNGFSASVSVSGSGSTRVITLTNIKTTGSGKYITIKAGAATDTSGNKTSALNSPKFSVNANVPKDTTEPTIAISNPSSSSIYEGGTVKYTVVFSDETGLGNVNLNENYVVLNNFSASVSVSGSGSTRTITLTNIKGEGTDKYITIKAGAATDTSGNKTSALNSPKFKVNVKDTTQPTISISSPNPKSIYVGENVTYTVVFSDETGLGSINLDSSYIVLNGFSASVSVSGSGSTRTITLTNVKGEASGSNYITIKAGAATDTSGNKTSALNSPTFTKLIKDTSIPTVTISSPSPSSIYEGESITYTVYFNDDIGISKVNFDSSFVILNGFSANVSVSGSGTSKRTVTLTNVKGSVGSKNYITVKAGAVVDTSSNTSKAASSASFTIKEKPVVDNVRPTIEISSPTPNSIYSGDTVEYVVYFKDNKELKTINLYPGNINLNGFTADISVSGSGHVRVVTLTNVKGNIGGGKTITILEGAGVDASGNKTIKTTSESFRIEKKDVPKPDPTGKDNIPPEVKISVANPREIKKGGTVKYNVTFSDNVKVTKVNLDKNKITLVGFSADVSVKVNGVKSAVITLKNIKSNPGVNKYIKIASGVALDKVGNRSKEKTSTRFTILENANKNKLTKTKYTLNCIDNLKLLGDINKEINYFASWLRAEKYTASYVQENNYVAEDETMTYMVEYFNGNTTSATGVSFNLTIPYKVDVEEINGGGKITSRTDDETVITWNIGTVPAYVASKHQGYCRLYVRVRFLENEKLENSEDISEVFYANLETIANNETTYSYMRQLYIDKTEGKTGLFKTYLTTIDTTNEVRPDDEITRAEFAKLLADSGILDIVIGSDEYKEFEDYEDIPSYARDAVSALVRENIIKTYDDGTFKPGNPIVMEDAMEMLANAASYISGQKLTTYKPVFVYTDALIGKDKKVSSKKDYIMELMRENVVVKYESNPDSYTLRKQAVQMVNSLTFRGPFIETLPENALKFVDIRNNSVFFYNIVAASNSYRYIYDYRLWQQIVEIE